MDGPIDPWGSISTTLRTTEVDQKPADSLHHNHIFIATIEKRDYDIENLIVIRKAFQST